MTYRIKNWDAHYENNRTRTMKVMQWVPLQNSHDGDGFTQLITEKNGMALFGAWVLIVQVASKCHPRGTLLRSNGHPHDSGSLSRMTRGDERVFREALKTLIEIGWIEEIDVKTQDSQGCGKSAGNTHPTDEERKEGTEGNRTPKRKHSFDKSPFYDFQVFSEELKDWDPHEIKDYYERAKGYSEANGGKYLNWVQAVKNWKAKDGGKNKKLAVNL